MSESDKEGQAALPCLAEPGIAIAKHGTCQAQVTTSELAEAIRRGWQINPERKRAYFESLDRAREKLVEIEDPVDLAMATARVMAPLMAEQAAALDDLQQREKDERIDAGKPTELAGVFLRVAGLEPKD